MPKDCFQEFLPNAVWKGDATRRQKEDRPSTEAVAETADDGGGHELEEGEERAEKATKKDGNEWIRRSNQRSKSLDIWFLKLQLVSIKLH